MNTELRWGFLGTGWIADVLASDLKAIGRTVAAVGSRSQKSADDFAQTHGIARAYASYEELCEDPEIDVIYVATPNPYHLENAKLALANGKHVLCEKPLTLNRQQADDLFEAAKSANRFVMEAMWSRFLPGQLALQRALASGEIGEVTSVYCEHSQNLPASFRPRLWDRNLGGGALLDLGIYSLSFIQSILGNPTHVSAMASVTSGGVDQRLVSILKFEGDRLAHFYTSMAVDGPADAVIYGTNGRIEARKPFWAKCDFDVFDIDGNLVRQNSETFAGTGRQMQVLAVEKAIGEGKIEHDLMPWSTSIALAAAMDDMRRQVGVVYDAD